MASLKIMSFNILSNKQIKFENDFFKKWYKGLNMNDFLFTKRFPLIINTIKKENADIVFLQEVDIYTFPLLSHLYDYHSEFFPNNPRANPESQWGTMILSKLPIKEDFDYKFMQKVKIGSLVAYNVHLSDSFISRTKQVKRLKKIIKLHELENDNLLICGDFNYEFKKGKGTYLCEKKKIDHIFYSKTFVEKKEEEKENCKNLLKIYGSDHRPIIANIFT
jgi:endonuclease/exonuclease/phosphatase family metal-dependent hydrolase